MQEIKDVPRLKGYALTKRITLAIDEELDQELKTLKTNDRVNVTEWIRLLIKENLPKLKKDLSI